ncbi:hypothetical protein K458DRAFT_139693 [Lentithecium fluviatile CBS 122367]|uniref:Uncharacterized protein n=1 Tax=Lentithecium fluviatile CBS 122367 TaxID=1168545 RepID=A0A6G1IJ39_9PLEO|nr:hypothetical protein K458DRAFT_139693 [Lentithecium fluviatile CBS 122367]
MSAVLCRLLFTGPEPMCRGQHPTQTMCAYELIRQNENIAAVKHYDLVTTQLLFANAEFRKKVIQSRVENLSCRFSKVLTKAYPRAAGIAAINEPLVWFDRVVRLKKTLMMSPRDYRIHFVVPGTPYDARWMKPEDIDTTDAECRDRRVKICLFPALAEHTADALGPDADIEDALVMNKPFLPSSREREGFNRANMISKAVVLVE